MNKRLLTGIAVVGAIMLIGSVSADAYYTHELTEHMAARNVATTSANPLSVSLRSSLPLGSSLDSQTSNNPIAIMNSQIAHMQTQMNKMFNSAFQDSGGMNSIDSQGSSQVSLKEKGKDYVVTAKIPGAKKGDIDIRLSGRLLTLSSKEKVSKSKKANNGRLAQQDQYASSFKQVFTLPGPVDASKMKSKFKNGELTLTIPKA